MKVILNINKSQEMFKLHQVGKELMAINYFSTRYYIITTQNDNNNKVSRGGSYINSFSSADYFRPSNNGNFNCIFSIENVRF